MPRAESTLDPISAPAPVFPIYLDTEMLTGFIATLEDGFSLTSNVSQQSLGTQGGQRRADVEASSGGLLSNLFRLGLSGEIASSIGQEDKEEYQFILQHTEASLFNRLRTNMHQLGITQKLDVNSPVPDIGDVVEISGVLSKNPLQEILELATVFGSSQPQSSSKSGRRSPNNRGTKDQYINSDTLQMIDLLQKSLDKASLLDFVLTTQLRMVPHVILTLRRSERIDVAMDLSLGGVCSVLGKVTNTYSPGTPVHLYRRSILQWMPESVVGPLFNTFDNIHEIEFDTSMITIRDGAIQVLPLAVFV